MSRYYGGWAPYVPVAARRAQAEREVAKLAKKGAVISPVKLLGKKIASTFWGTAWCDNLESYHDFENRLPRGRTYVRNGSVVDLQIAPREVTAMVSGSSLYKVKITIGEVVKAHWTSICADCSGAIDSLVELLQGRFSKGVMERICRQGAGLFPKPSEIRFSCNCPDYASMCKHVAAALYGVGARLDAEPILLFGCVRSTRTIWLPASARCCRWPSRGQLLARCWKQTISRRCSVLTWAMARRQRRPLCQSRSRRSRRFGRRPRKTRRPKDSVGEKSRTSGRDDGKRGRT